MNIAVEDIDSAYRRFPTSRPGTVYHIRHMEPPPHKKAAVFHEVYGHNFGLTASVVNFCRVSEFIATVAKRRFVNVTPYIDDNIIPRI